MDPSVFFFWLFAAIAIVGALGVITMRQPIHSALFLLLTFLCVAALFILSHAEFLAAVQVLVYAGGIMVLFLFTIMLVNIRRVQKEPYLNRRAGIAVLAGFFLFLLVGGMLTGSATARKTNPAPAEALRTTVIETRDGKTEVKGNSEAVAWGLYRDYALPFEIASLFLLVAMIGAVVLGKRTMEKFD